MASLCASALHSDVLPVPGGPMCVFSWISVFSHDECASALHIYVLPVTGGPVCTCVCMCVCVHVHVCVCVCVSDRTRGEE